MAGEQHYDEETLLSFKGIGAYTAGAIRSFAFRERAAILDTNVARVLFRVFVGKGDPKSHAMKRQLWTLSETLMPMRIGAAGLVGILSWIHASRKTEAFAQQSNSIRIASLTPQPRSLPGGLLSVNNSSPRSPK